MLTNQHPHFLCYNRGNHCWLPGAFVLTLISGIIGINALATRRTSDNPGFVTLVAAVALLMVIVDVAVMAFHFSQME